MITCHWERATENTLNGILHWMASSTVRPMCIPWDSSTPASEWQYRNSAQPNSSTNSYIIAWLLAGRWMENLFMPQIWIVNLPQRNRISIDWRNAYLHFPYTYLYICVSECRCCGEEVLWLTLTESSLIYSFAIEAIARLPICRPTWISYALHPLHSVLGIVYGMAVPLLCTEIYGMMGFVSCRTRKFLFLTAHPHRAFRNGLHFIHSQLPAAWQNRTRTKPSVRRWTTTSADFRISITTKR